MIDKGPNRGGTCTWERARAIFGNPAPPTHVWERQFDYNDDDLKRLAATPFHEIDGADLWYYFHDLAYVTLQPELFHYLFPVCLMDWRNTLLRNEPCAHGDSEFHYGLWRGNVLDKMLTPRQRDDVFDFFRDSLLERLDAERGFARCGSTTPAYGWIGRFNSLALVMPQIERVWTPWWSLTTPGRAVCALQYCSGLIYFEGENPVFDSWTQHRGGGGPYLWANDSFIFDHGWLPTNVELLRGTLSFEYVLSKAEQAVERLANEPEQGIARKIASDARTNRERVESRVEELTRLLAEGDANPCVAWTD